MAKIVISGYYGFDNLGDEAILQSMIECFKGIREDVSITVLSSKPEVTAKRYKVNSVNRHKVLSVIREIKNCSLFISGGGSLLQDVTGWKSIPFYLGQVGLALLLGKPAVIYAQGIGPINSNLYKKLVYFIASKVKLITVRDRNSFQLLTDYGVKKDLIKNTVDPVFGLAGREWEKGKVLLEKEGLEFKEPLIGIAVRPWDDNKYLKDLARTADYLTDLTGGKVVIIPMYYKQDYPVGQQLYKLMKEEAHLLNKNYTPLEMLEVFSVLDFLVGVRLHSLIFAAIHNVPFVALNYDPKIGSFLREIGVDSQLKIEEIDVDILKRLCKTIWTRREQFTKILAIKRSLFYRIARRDIRDLLQFLED